jgi:hypothetical protein
LAQQHSAALQAQLLHPGHQELSSPAGSSSNGSAALFNIQMPMLGAHSGGPNGQFPQQSAQSHHHPHSSHHSHHHNQATSKEKKCNNQQQLEERVKRPMKLVQIFGIFIAFLQHFKYRRFSFRSPWAYKFQSLSRVGFH